MLTILPLLAFLLTWLYVSLRPAGPDRDWRQAFLLATLVWGVLTTAIMELLSLGHALVQPIVAAIWAGAVIVPAIALCRRLDGSPLGVATVTAPLRIDLRVLGRRAMSLMRLPEAPGFVAAIGVVMAIAGLVAIHGGISTNDVLDYHLPRVMHWIQNQSVEFYPTAVSRQLNLNPWSEYAIAQFMILGGSDAWANLVQWFAFLGSGVGVSLVARELGANERGQVFAAVFATTIPMAVLQGSTAQNDLAVAYWLVVLVYGVLRVRNRALAGQPLAGWLTPVGLALGAAVGLAVLTKTTAYVFALPFLLWLAVIALRGFRMRAVPLGIIAGATALALNAGHYVRNHRLYGSPMGPGQESPPGQDWGKYTNDVFSLDTLLSNTTRFLALNIGLPDRAGEQTSVVTDFLARFGIDASDPATTWTGQLFNIAAPHTNEDGAGNLLHLALIGVLLVAVLVVPALRRVPVVLYATCTVLGFLVFSLLLKWSPWSTRLYLATFILFAPVAGLAFGMIRWQWLPRVAATVLLIGAIPYLLYAQHRPVIGNDPFNPTTTNGTLVQQSPEDQLFVTRPQLQLDFEAAAAFVATTRCGEIGLLRFDAAEYPIWSLLDATLPYQPTIQHVEVINDTAPLMQAADHEEYAPCAVLAFREFAGDHRTVTVNGRDYVRVWESPSVAAYQPAWYVS